MIKYHLTYAIRHLRKKPTYSLLNIVGLSIGLACFTIIALWVKSELSFDKFNTKGERIYRVAGRIINDMTSAEQAVTSVPFAATMMNDFPEVESATRIDIIDATVQYKDQRFIEDDMLVTDPSFFNIFDFKLLRGDEKTVLTQPYSIVLSESLAKKYFGNADPVGQSMTIFHYDPDGNGAQYKVTGIIEDCPLNSHFTYKALISFKTWEVAEPEIIGDDRWLDNGIFTYLLLQENASVPSMQSRFEAFTQKYAGAIMEKYKFKYEIYLQPLFDIHLKSNLRYEIGPTTSMSYLVIFGTIGVIVLLLASINYVNLSTAYSAERFKEVGVHKVMGAVRRQLVTQYLTESWLLGVVSLLIAFVWIELGRPLFESVTDRPLEGLYQLNSVLVLLSIASVVGLLAGFYPSVVLSTFRPVNVLKGNISGMSSSMLRKFLVVVQYSITIILVIGIIVVEVQMEFINKKDLGYNHDNLVILGVNGSREVMNGYDAFMNELTANSNFAGVTRSNTSIVGGLGNAMALSEDVTGQKVNAEVYRLRGDYDYIDVHRMKIIAGRNFRTDNAADSTAFIVNESTTKAYGFENPSDAIGKMFQYNGLNGSVIGVVSDFNFDGLQHRVQPTCIYLLRDGFSRITVRLKGNSKEAFDELTAVWKKHFPNSVYDYRFYEDALERQYQAESRFSTIFLVFSIISLIIACLGLFALVSYTVERRSKEIGIRKVLGASVTNILSMLSKEFLLLVAISSIVAIPAGYYFMSEWLTSFAYHVTLNAFMFIAAGVLVLVIAWATVSLRTFRAAQANPVNSLRSE